MNHARKSLLQIQSMIKKSLSYFIWPIAVICTIRRLPASPLGLSSGINMLAKPQCRQDSPSPKGYSYEMIFQGKEQRCFFNLSFYKIQAWAVLSSEQKITGILSDCPREPAVCTNFQKPGVAQGNWSKGQHQDKISIISILVSCHDLLRIILLICIMQFSISILSKTWRILQT